MEDDRQDKTPRAEPGPAPDAHAVHVPPDVSYWVPPRAPIPIREHVGVSWRWY